MDVAKRNRILREAAQDLEELNLARAWTTLRDLGRLSVDAFKSGYAIGRGRGYNRPKAPDPVVQVAPEVGQDDDQKKSPEASNEQPTPTPKRAGKRSTKKVKAVQKKKPQTIHKRDCSPAVNLKNRVRCKKPGGGWVYYDKGKGPKT